MSLESTSEKRRRTAFGVMASMTNTGNASDTAVNGSVAAAKCGHAFFGTSQTLFATDAPFDPRGGSNLMARTIEAVHRLEITPAERARIFDGNALELLNMNGSTP